MYVSLTSTSSLRCNIVISNVFPHLAPTVCFFALWPVSCYIHCHDALSTEVVFENEIKLFVDDCFGSEFEEAMRIV